MSRISVELTADQHQKIKVFASLQGKSIKDVVLESLFGNLDRNFNKETIAAIKEVRSGKGLNSYKNVDELFSKLSKK
jgi:uncharacterized protein (DUF1778 family)